MKRTIIAVICAAVVLVVTVFAMRAIAQKEDVVVKKVSVATYTCSMHPEIRATRAGKCPKCGMALVKADIESPVSKEDEMVKKVSAAMYTCSMHPDVMATWAGKCPKCSMTLVKVDAKAPASVMGGCPWCPMAGKGASGGMMMRCPMMMAAGVRSNDAAALLALKGYLELTEKQVKTLQAVAEKAREEAKAVLTETQTEKLQKLGEALSAVTGTGAKDPATTGDDKDDKPAPGRGRMGCRCCGR